MDNPRRTVYMNPRGQTINPYTHQTLPPSDPMSAFAMSKSTVRTLQELEDEELGSVCFVRDYVELCFDGPILRSFVGPTVYRQGSRVQFPDAGSRDALCGFIGETVERVVETASEVTLHFGRDTVTVPLHTNRMDIVEVAHFMPTLDGKLTGMFIWP